MARKETGVTFCGVLFCEDPTHEEAIRRIVKYYDYFIVKHQGEDDDEDFAFEENERCDKEGNESADKPVDVNTARKDHWHFVLIFPYNFKHEVICKKLGIAPNYLQRCSSRKSYVRYMTHQGNRAKQQYTIEDFMTNRPYVLQEDLNGMFTQAEIRAKVYQEIIQNKNCFEDYIDFTEYFFANGYSDVLRQFPQIFRDVYQALTGKPVYVHGEGRKK